MKKNILFCFLLFSSIAFGQKKIDSSSFKLIGYLEGQEDGIVVLSYLNLEGKFIHDTCKLNNGRFLFTGKIKEPTNAYLDGNIKSKSINDPNTTDFFIEPSIMNISLLVDNFKKAKISGSSIQNEMSRLQKFKDSVYDNMGIKLLETEYSNAIVMLNKSKENIELQELAKNAFDKLIPYRDKIKTIDFDYIKRNPDSYISAYLLRYYFSSISVDSLAKIYDNFTFKIQQSIFGDLVRQQIVLKLGAGVGSKAKVFSINDINGLLLDVSKLIGKKYILLDFWASWCLPCRKGSPYLIELYKKYQDNGLEVICISSDRNIEDWKKAVEKDKTSLFHHIRDNLDIGEFQKGNFNQFNVNKEYVVTVLPTKILIDTKGIIIFRQENDDDSQLTEQLRKVFRF
ncbi:TlpA disulfide reductase family protein [Sediminibacterium sp.]|uniref:TlpA disulfide reductase family protein n=1 Tax=Sediminibacterium sp. TaxID=1917865 RepID=UPI002735C647|nr:TlpA disulfide reductase family protein [Sediminibacterium sp.]MDP3394310.1 TlpA disulfide reductase family protein [Sediminibacterium sp.]MDP3568145.1 TlpA disulfide reductase family protein [Sediminibacterium sp.]